MSFTNGSKVYIKRGGYKAESLGDVPDIERKQNEVVPALIPFSKDPSVRKLGCNECGRQIPALWLSDKMIREWNGVCPICSGHFNHKKKNWLNFKLKDRIQSIKREKKICKN